MVCQSAYWFFVERRAFCCVCLCLLACRSPSLLLKKLRVDADEFYRLEGLGVVHCPMTNNRFYWRPDQDLFEPDPSAVAVSRIRRIFYCRRKSAEK